MDFPAIFPVVYGVNDHAAALAAATTAMAYSNVLPTHDMMERRREDTAFTSPDVPVVWGMHGQLDPIPVVDFSATEKRVLVQMAATRRADYESALLALLLSSPEPNTIHTSFGTFSGKAGGTFNVDLETYGAADYPFSGKSQWYQDEGHFMAPTGRAAAALNRDKLIADSLRDFTESFKVPEEFHPPVRENRATRRAAQAKKKRK